MKITSNEKNIKNLIDSIVKISSENRKIKSLENLSEELIDFYKHIDNEKFDVFNKMDIPIIATKISKKNLPGKIIYVNSAFLNFAKEKEKEIISKAISKYFHKRENKNNPFFNGKFWDEISAGKNRSSHLIVNVNREKRNVDVSIFKYTFLDENYFIFLIKDVTNELKYINLLEEERSRYKYFFENSVSAIFRVVFTEPISTKLSIEKQAKLLFERGVLAECNYLFSKNMGFGEKEFLKGKKFNEIFGEFENPKNKSLAIEFVKNNFKLKGKVVKQIALSGEDAFFTLNAFGIIKDNYVKEFWASYYDVTELEKIKLDLEKSKNELTNLFENSPVALAILDENLNTLSFNNVMKNTFGYNEKDLPNLESWYFGPLNTSYTSKISNKRWAVWAKKLKNNEIDFIKKETFIKTKKGDIKNTIVSFNYISGKFLISISDITDLQKAKEEAERAKLIIERSPNLLIQWELKNNRIKPIYITNNISKLGYSANEIIANFSSIKKIFFNSNKIFSERKNAAKEHKEFLTQSIILINDSNDKQYFESYISFIYENNKVYLWEILSDVTEKHTTEVKLKESMEQYRSVFENSPIGIFQFDTTGQITNVNNSFIEIFSSDKEFILKLNLLKDIKNKGVREAALKAIKGKPSFYEGFYETLREKKKVYIRFIAQPIFDEKGKVTSVLGLVEDTTEKQKAKAELEETRDAYRQKANELNFILDHLNDIVYEQTREKNIIYVSGSIKKVLGYTPTEFILRRKEILTDNPINKEIGEHINKVFQQKRSVRYYVEVFSKKGKRILLEVNESPISTQNKVTGLIGVARDVTETYRRSQLQEALYSISSETLKAKSLPELYKYIHKTIQKFMPANNFFIAIWDRKENLIKFEYYVDEIDSENPGFLVPRNGFTEYAISAKINKILYKEDLKKLILENHFILIGTLPESIAVVSLLFENGNRGVIVLQDYYNKNAYGKEDLDFLKIVSTQIIQSIEKKQADEELVRTYRLLKKKEKELRAQKYELEKSNANKDKLFSIIAHDLRSPFTALLGLTNMLNEMLEDFTPEEIKEMLASLDSSARGLYKLLENLLNWSRLQLGSFKINPKEIDIKTIALNVKEYLSTAAGQKNIEINVNINEPLIAFADEYTIETVIRNLVNNSIKFTNTGGEIRISGRKTEENVEIVIEDNGIGMNKELTSNLFKVDKKVSRVGTNNEPGTGLGLILVKEYIEKNGGTIKVESEENIGTKFILTLPIKNNSVD